MIGNKKNGLGKLMLSKCLLVFCGVVLTLRCGAQGDEYLFQNQRELYEHNNSKILFIDNLLFQNNVNTDYFIPQPTGTQTIIVPDRPWEAYKVGFSTFFKEHNKYYLYYQSIMPGNEERYLSLASSDDGLNWKKQNVNKIIFKGSRQNNIVSNQVFEISSMFKSIINGKKNYTMLAMGKDLNHYLVQSNDGISFLRNKSRHLSFSSDSENQIFYDLKKRLYVGYFRSWEMNPILKTYVRKVGYSSFNNFNNILDTTKSKLKNRTYRWGKSMPPAINKELQDIYKVNYKEMSNRFRDVYTFPVLTYGNYYFAFPSIFNKKSLNSIDGDLYVQTLFSKDGEQWDEIGVFWDKKTYPRFSQIYMNLGQFIDEKYIYFFALLADNTHGVKVKESKICLVKYEIDRIAGITNKNKNNSGRLVMNINPEINLSAMLLNAVVNKKGEITVNALNKSNRVISTAKLIAGNYKKQQLNWSNNNLGATEKIQFIFDDAVLYSIEKK